MNKTRHIQGNLESLKGVNQKLLEKKEPEYYIDFEH